MPTNEQLFPIQDTSINPVRKDPFQKTFDPSFGALGSTGTGPLLTTLAQSPSPVTPTRTVPPPPVAPGTTPGAPGTPGAPAPTPNLNPPGPRTTPTTTPGGTTPPPVAGPVSSPLLPQGHPSIPPDVLGQIQGIVRPGDVNSIARAYALYANWARNAFGGGSTVGVPPGAMSREQFEAFIGGSPGAGFGGTGTPDNPNIPNAGPGQGFDFNSEQFFNQFQRPLFEEIFPGITFSGLPFDPTSRANQFDQLAGLLGAGGPFGLPGREADTTAGVIFNILSNEAQRQVPRASEAEELLRSILSRSEGSTPFALSTEAGEQARDLIAPGALDSRRDRLLTQLRENVAASRNAALNQASDAGLLGRGGTSQDVLAQLSNQSGEQLRRGTFDIENQLEDELLNRLALANQTGATGTGIFQALSAGPRREVSGRLESAENLALGPLVQFLQQILNVQQGEALAQDKGTFFERGGGDLLGELFKAAGTAIGGT